MADEKEERLKALKQQLILVKASLQNAANLLNTGKIVHAATIDELMIAKKVLESKIAGVESGEGSSAAEQQGSSAIIKSADEIGIPSHLRVKRHYTLSPAAHEQRRHAAKQKQPNLKGNKNAWKHGKFAQGYINSFIKPCKSSCPDYPCEIIAQGGTRAGGDCLDRAGVIQSYRAIIDALKNKKFDDFNDMAAVMIGKTIQTAQGMFDDILRDGSFIKEERHDKDGVVCGFRYVPHPAMFALPKLLQSIGLTPGEMMLTPKALATKESNEHGVKTIADLMSSLGSSLKKEQTPDDDD